MLPIAADELREINPYLNAYHVALRTNDDLDVTHRHPITHRLNPETH
jgi:hypothetical protein